MGDWYCVINGQRYGPEPLTRLQDWARQGSLKPADLVWTEGMGEWAPASTAQGQFSFAPTPPPLGTVPAPVPGGPPISPLRAHRGGLILTLGIVGLVCCGIAGIIAWVMGHSDLREIKEGRMDPAGRGMTQAGMICGIISVIFSAIGLVVGLIGMATGVTGMHHGPGY